MHARPARVPSLAFRLFDNFVRRVAMDGVRSDSPRLGVTTLLPHPQQRKCVAVAKRIETVPSFEFIRDEFNRFMLKDDFRLHCAQSSLISKFPSTLYWLWCSDFKSR
jgi:hypothetical protein